MTSYRTEQIRNVALLGHGSSGKTSLAEAALFTTGAIKRMGRADDGNTVSDWDPEEVRRKVSVNASVIPVEFKDHKINLIDTPGYVDFSGEVHSALSVVNATLVVLDAVAGVEVGTELVWGYAEEKEVPRLTFINKMDRENANFHRALESMRTVFGGTIIPVQLPIGSQDEFAGVIDLVTMKAYTGTDGKEEDIPEDMESEVDEARLQLVEAAVEGDDDLMMKYLEGEELSEEEIRRGLCLGIQCGQIVPVFCGSATANIGIRRLLDSLIAYVADPGKVQITATNPTSGAEVNLRCDPEGPLAAFVFKTVADPYVGKLTYFRVFSGQLHSDSRVLNARTGQEERLGQLYYVRGKEQINTEAVTAGDIGAASKLAETLTGDTVCERNNPIVLPQIQFPEPLYAVAVTPKTKADSAKMGASLTRLTEEDPTLRTYYEPITKQTILAGMGDAHIDVAVRRLESKFGVGVETSMPRVPYRETITKVNAAQYRHKKQTGGAGQFGEVHLRVEPLERGAEFEYANEVFGGAISSSFIPSIEKGIRQVMEQGVIAGYPVVDLKAAVYDGKEHPVDSKDIAFQIAGRESFKLAVKGANPVLLEPIYNVQVTVPEEYMGDVLGDLNTKRARVQGMEQQRGRSVITAQVPYAEMLRYATDLRSITQGRGFYTMTFSHYDVVPSHIAEQIIAAAEREAEEEE